MGTAGVDLGPAPGTTLGVAAAGDGPAGVDPGAVVGDGAHGGTHGVGPGDAVGELDTEGEGLGVVESVGGVVGVVLVVGELVVVSRWTSVRGTQVYDGSGMNPGGTSCVAGIGGSGGGRYASYSHQIPMKVISSTAVDVRTRPHSMNLGHTRASLEVAVSLICQSPAPVVPRLRWRSPDERALQPTGCCQRA